MMWLLLAALSGCATLSAPPPPSFRSTIPHDGRLYGDLLGSPRRYSVDGFCEAEAVAGRTAIALRARSNCRVTLRQPIAAGGVYLRLAAMAFADVGYFSGMPHGRLLRASLQAPNGTVLRQLSVPVLARPNEYVQLLADVYVLPHEAPAVLMARFGFEATEAQPKYGVGALGELLVLRVPMENIAEEAQISSNRGGSGDSVFEGTKISQDTALLHNGKITRESWYTFEHAARNGTAQAVKTIPTITLAWPAAHTVCALQASFLVHGRFARSWAVYATDNSTKGASLDKVISVTPDDAPGNNSVRWFGCRQMTSLHLWLETAKDGVWLLTEVALLGFNMLEFGACAHDCRHGGTCLDLDDRCGCIDGWHGAVCTVDNNECATRNAGCGGGDAARALCINRPSSFGCKCKPGFVDASGGKTAPGVKCLDVDECKASNGGCDHTCANTVGSFTCSCRPGYQLLNGKRCKPRCAQRCSGVSVCVAEDERCALYKNLSIDHQQCCVGCNANYAGQFCEIATAAAEVPDSVIPGVKATKEEQFAAAAVIFAAGLFVFIGIGIARDQVSNNTETYELNEIDGLLAEGEDSDDDEIRIGGYDGYSDDDVDDDELDPRVLAMMAEFDED